ncbi:MAG: ISKra4 family transposase [Planctomycetes bacterium]|nr:ISKra4 family transposase [Planctomycetota bacterium]
MMIMAEMAAFDNVKELTEMADDLATFVRQAAVEGTAAHEVEKGVWQRVLAMGRQATGHFLQMQGDGDVGETIEMPDGEELKRLPEPHQRTYHSIFGPFTLSRFVYGTREGQRIDFVPLDARLKLPESEYSYVLQDWAGMLSVEHAFARTAQTLETILGLSLPVDSLERMNRKMAESVEGFRSSLEKPPAEEEGEILVVTADGKGIPMRRPADQRPVGARRKKGEKANKKQMATIGCVYTVDPKHRTPEDVVEALFRECLGRQPDESPEPVAQHKRLWSSLTYDEGDMHVDAETEVFTWMAQEADARRRDGQPTVCLMDGQRSLWTSCATHLPCEDVVEILDLLHATGYLWDAAYLFHAEGSGEASAFVRNRTLRILRGEVGYVIGGLRQMATKRGLSAAKQKKLTQICNYFHRNRNRMHYDEYLAAGFPIASGVIEGACRHLVKDRMERAGMRWTIDGAQAMLNLRSTSINDQWSPLQVHRIRQETQRLYPQRQILQQLTWQLAT